MGNLLCVFSQSPKGEIDRNIVNDEFTSCETLAGGYRTREEARIIGQGVPSQIIQSLPLSINKDLKIRAQEELGLDTSCYNFAIAGHFKTGKSSLVNAILGEDVAAIGEFQTTLKIEKYAVKSLPNVFIWDMPGCGSQEHGGTNYFWDKQLFAFDCLIILTQENITDEEINLAKLAQKANQPIIIVRSKCDTTLENQMKTREIKAKNQEAATNLVNHMSTNFKLPEDLRNVKCFFVSSIVMKEEKPSFHFEEKEFIKELKAASVRGRS